jgi:hypothetical protein
MAVVCTTPVKDGSSGRPGNLQTAGGAKGTQSKPRILTSQLTGLIPLPHLLTKAAAYFKWLVLPKHVIAGTRQLVRQRLDRALFLDVTRESGIKRRANPQARLCAMEEDGSMEGCDRRIQAKSPRACRERNAPRTDWRGVTGEVIIPLIRAPCIGEGHRFSSFADCRREKSNGPLSGPFFPARSRASTI